MWFLPHHVVWGKQELKNRIAPRIIVDNIFFTIRMFLEEHRGKGVLVLLGELGFHARDGGFEEEGDEVFVCALCAALYSIHCFSPILSAIFC